MTAKSWSEGFLDDLEEIAHEQAERLRIEHDAVATMPSAVHQLRPVEPDDVPRVVLTKASSIVPRRARWLWNGRIALGTLSLLAGPQGVGKSTIAYWLAAQITRGELYGELHGQPRAVIVCSTEDTWEEVIVPRLLAAEADLDFVYRVDVTAAGELSVPRDIDGLEVEALAVRAALLLLDPLISRLGRVDTHKDAETRTALEPLGRLAARTGMAVLGLMHFNKKSTTEVLDKIMASTAFSAVARSVSCVMPDPEDDDGQRRLFATPKNNLGPDMPTMTFAVSTKVVGQDPDDGKDIETSCVIWGDDSTLSFADALEVAQDRSAGSQTSDATQLLRQLLDDAGGCIDSATAKKAGRAEQISASTITRAARRMGLLIESVGATGGRGGRITTWTDPASISPDEQRSSHK